jgi:hypothetical protein
MYICEKLGEGDVERYCHCYDQEGYGWEVRKQGTCLRLRLICSPAYHFREFAKGGIVARFVIDDSSICLINCHLAAGQHHVRQRNADVAAMVEDKAVFPAAGAFEEPVAYVGGGDGTMVLDHEIVFVSSSISDDVGFMSLRSSCVGFG